MQVPTTIQQVRDNVDKAPAETRFYLGEGDSCLVTAPLNAVAYLNDTGKSYELSIGDRMLNIYHDDYTSEKEMPGEIISIADDWDRSGFGYMTRDEALAWVDAYIAKGGR